MLEVQVAPNSESNRDERRHGLVQEEIAQLKKQVEELKNEVRQVEPFQKYRRTEVSLTSPLLPIHFPFHLSYHYHLLDSISSENRLERRIKRTNSRDQYVQVVTYRFCLYSRFGFGFIHSNTGENDGESGS